jgi:ABC-type nitrate/sulfonate/bicarbonate transport system substrate-binding protein
LVCGIAVIGCGSSDSGGSGSASSGGGSSSPSTAKVSISIGQYTALYASIFIAQTQGFYKQAGVDVTIQGNGTNYATAMLSNHADLTLSGPTSAFAPAQQGKATRVVAETTRALPGGILVAKDSPIKTLQDLAGKKFAAFAPGSSSYGFGEAVSSYIQQHGAKKAMDVAVQSSTSGDFGELVASGAADATQENPEGAIPLLNAGKVRWLVAPGDPLMTTLIPATVVGFSVWTLQDHIDKNETGIARFVAGLRMANKWIAAHSDAQVAQSLSKVGGFSAIKMPDLVAAVKLDRTNYPTEDGNISQERWDKDSIPVWKTWKMDLNVEDPTFSWAKIVNMKPWNDSTAIVDKAGGA